MTSHFRPALAALALATLIPAAALADVPLRTITVSGEATVEVKPDMATLSIGVRHEAPTARAAMDLVAAAMGPVMERLVAAGIPQADIQTGSLGLDPVYDYSGATPKMTGYAAHTSVTVEVHDLGIVGGVLDAVVSDGANSLGGISFGLADPSAAMDEARADAVADARARAELYAGAAGVALGDLVTLTEQGSYAPQPVMYDMRMEAAAGAPMPVSGGEVGVSASVTLVYEIGDGD
jgi:uncharacterized protein YggE